MERRSFLKSIPMAAAGLTGASAIQPMALAQASTPQSPYAMKLGMVTYNMGKDMKLEELIAFCETVGLTGVELRTTHAHGVEVSLTSQQRADVKARFADSPVAIAGLGSAFEYHSKDPAEVAKHVADSKEYLQLAADVGAPGVKLRPNGLHEDEPEDQTCERIGKAWREVAAFGADLGVETRMEVHGRGTKEPRVMRKLLDAADHKNALICWNSNTGEDDENGSIKKNFDLLKHAISLVHITEIGVYQYPWQELFDLLNGMGYEGFCLAEIQFNEQPERFMRHYKTLFELYTHNYRYPQ